MIESMVSICREHAKSVKHWRDGRVALRWCAAGMLEAGKQFRCVNGHMHVPAVRAELRRVTADRVVRDEQNDAVDAAWSASGRHRVSTYFEPTSQRSALHPFRRLVHAWFHWMD